MTSISIPDFVFQMFEQKVVEINTVIVHKLCDEYGIDKAEAKKFLKKELNINFNIINEDIEQIKVIKKHKKKPIEADNNNTNDETPTGSSFCDARVFIPADLVVKQCSRSKVDNKNFCKLHQRLHEEGKLKYGTIHEQKPESISTEKLKMKVKRNIY